MDAIDLKRAKRDPKKIKSEYIDPPKLTDFNHTFVKFSQWFYKILVIIICDS